MGHVTRDWDTSFKVKRSKVNLQGAGCILWRPPAQLVNIHDTTNYSLTHPWSVGTQKNKTQSQVGLRIVKVEII